MAILTAGSKPIVGQKSLEHPQPEPVAGPEPKKAPMVGTKEPILTPVSPKIEEISKEQIEHVKIPSDTTTVKIPPETKQTPLQEKTPQKSLESINATPSPWEKFINIFKGHKEDENHKGENKEPALDTKLAVAEEDRAKMEEITATKPEKKE